MGLAAAMVSTVTTGTGTAACGVVAGDDGDTAAGGPGAGRDGNGWDGAGGGAA